jgi:hypothetical protein
MSTLNEIQVQIFYFLSILWSKKIQEYLKFNYYAQQEEEDVSQFCFINKVGKISQFLFVYYYYIFRNSWLDMVYQKLALKVKVYFWPHQKLFFHLIGNC